jgi:hypothetical protein
MIAIPHVGNFGSRRTTMKHRRYLALLPGNLVSAILADALGSRRGPALVRHLEGAGLRLRVAGVLALGQLGRHAVGVGMLVAVLAATLAVEMLRKGG